jgi:hypothetical protein
MLPEPHRLFCNHVQYLWLQCNWPWVYLVCVTDLLECCWGGPIRADRRGRNGRWLHDAQSLHLCCLPPTPCPPCWPVPHSYPSHHTSLAVHGTWTLDLSFSALQSRLLVSTHACCEHHGSQRGHWARAGRLSPSRCCLPLPLIQLQSALALVSPTLRAMNVRL